MRTPAGRGRMRGGLPALGVVVAAVSALSGCGGQAGGAGLQPGATGGQTPAAGHRTGGHHRQSRHHRRRVAAIHTGSAALTFSRVSSLSVQAQPPPGSCHALGTGLLARPDPRCTPGALNPAVRQSDIGQTICVAGWTATVRPAESVTEPEKRASMRAYGDTAPLGDYEYDHLVPLELGGATNDPRNLWPEPGATPNPKDGVELRLHDRVCSGQMRLARAQREIAANWVRLARGLGAGRGAPADGGGEGAPADGGGGGAASSGGCTARAVYSSRYGDYDVYVTSDEPDQTVTVTGGGHARTWHTDSRGAADVYFPGRPGSRARVEVAVGSARCATTL